MLKSLSIALVAAALILAQPATAGVEIQPAPIVQRRQKAMKDMAVAAKTIAAMFSGELIYDRARLREAASVFVVHGAELSALFTGKAGTDSEADDRKIAAERKVFDDIAARLQELAVVFDRKAARAGDVITPDMRMGSVPGGGSLLGARRLRAEVEPSAIPAEHLFHMMLETCTACHSKYRLSK